MQKVYVILGYESRDPAGMYVDFTEYEVYAENYDEAIEKCKAIFPHANFHLKRYIEIIEKK
jgi:hypothetical protein